MPPAKFCTVPDSAMPIAIPPAASSAASEVVFTPRVDTVTMISSTVREMLTSEVMNEASVRSVCLRLKTRSSIFFTLLINHAPIR